MGDVSVIGSIRVTVDPRCSRPRSPRRRRRCFPAQRLPGSDRPRRPRDRCETHPRTRVRYPHRACAVSHRPGVSASGVATARRSDAVCRHDAAGAGGQSLLVDGTSAEQERGGGDRYEPDQRDYRPPPATTDHRQRGKPARHPERGVVFEDPPLYSCNSGPGSRPTDRPAVSAPTGTRRARRSVARRDTTRPSGPRQALSKRMLIDELLELCDQLASTAAASCASIRDSIALTRTRRAFALRL